MRTLAEEKPRIKVVPHVDGSLTICCGNQCVEVEARAAPDAGDDLQGGLTPPDAKLAAPDSLVVLTQGELVEREALGLFPVDLLAAESFEKLRSGHIQDLRWPRTVLNARSTRHETLDMVDLGALVSSYPELLSPGKPIQLAMLGGRIELGLLEPFMDAAQTLGQRLEVHVLTGGEDLP